MRRVGAFTLVELLIVIGIISILALITFPIFGQVREKARQSSCMSNQHELALHLIQFAQDHDGVFPSDATIWQDVEAPRQLLRCPSTAKHVANGYVINGAITGEPLDSFRVPTETAVTIDGLHLAASLADSYDHIAYSWRDLAKRHNGKFIVSYLDAHVELTDQVPMLVKMPQWQDLDIWFAADYGVTQGPGVTNWLDRSNFKLNARPANKNHQPEYRESVESLGGAPALFFRPPNNNPNMLITDPVADAWGAGRNEATLFIVFHPTGTNENSEYTVLDQQNGDPAQATRMRQDSAGSYAPAVFGAPPAGDAVTVSLAADKATIDAGQSVTLTWTSNGATQVQSSNFGATEVSGTKMVSPQETTTYTITVKKGSQQATGSVTVTVNNIPPTITLTASPTSIKKAGGSTTLTWTSARAESVVSSNFGAGGLNGSVVVTPAATTTYTITVSGGGKQSTAIVTVTVGKESSTGAAAGRISWFRRTAAIQYPPNDVPWNTPTLWTVVSSDNRYIVYQKGVPWQEYIGGPDWLAPDRLTIGGTTHGATANQRSFDGYIGEIIIFRRVLNDNEREKVERYLMVKFDLK